MVNTTKYKAESEILLPRNLKLTFIKKSTLPYQYYGEIPVIVISVSLQNNDQFKIPSGCSKFYLGKLSSVKLSYLDSISESKKTKKETKAKNEIIVPTKVKSERKNRTKAKRCLNGSRKNKITGLCESILTASVIKENKPLKQKTKAKRCPNGTRKNKITGLCEKINSVLSA
jgi:cellulose biosynthesis protein BcsQ